LLVFGDLRRSAAGSIPAASTKNCPNPFSAWLAGFANGNVSNFDLKAFDFFVRAVRTGSCAP